MNGKRVTVSNGENDKKRAAHIFIYIYIYTYKDNEESLSGVSAFVIPKHDFNK